MIDRPQIVQTTAQLTGKIHVTVPRDQIRTVMGPGLRELTDALKKQGIAPTGPWFTHHLKIDPTIFDFEICLPVSTPIAASGRVVPGEMPAMTVARTIYHGPYEKLGDAWGEFNAWVNANGHTPAVDLWERYLFGPESSPDPANWQTELNRGLVSV